MNQKSFGIGAIVLGLALSVFGQDSIDKYGVQRPTAEQLAENKRVFESLLHPTFISLRLVSERRASPPEEPTTTPAPYTVDEWLHFELFITQNSNGLLMLSNYMSPYWEYRTELVKDGDMVSYSKKAQEKLEQAEHNPVRSGSNTTMKFEPGRELRAYTVDLEDWYEVPLQPGHYQLIVRKRFRPDGDWVQSNPVTFDVIPRKPASPIADGVSLRLVPEGLKPTSEDRPYRFSNDTGVAVEIVNDSNERIPITVIDQYYGHRPKLFKDGKPIPYSDETAKVIDSKEKDPRLVVVTRNLHLDPKTTSRLDGLSLSQWYGPLAPGTYRLTNRRRFEIGGPWTKDSAELVFEILP